MRSEEQSSPVAEGDILAGKYRVERVIGAGGMGVVVAARHLQLDQMVALKFILPSALDETDASARFLREARAAVRLKSEHVAKVLDVGTLENGAPYMVMEYLEGSDLASVIHRQAPLPFDVAADYVIQVCEALSEAHALGIVHRDLKPQNLFLTRGVGGAPVVKVLDFGISKVAQPAGSQALTQTATVMGSPLYMAPEQMRSARDVDNRTDIWALGVVLHEMLTRKLPFEADSMTALAIKIVQDPLTPVEQLRPEIPRELAQVVARCLEKDVTRRFPDTGELAEALEPFAPSSSRAVVDRARKVVSGLQQTMGMVAAGRPTPMASRADASGPSRAISSPTHPAPQTPEPWSEARPPAAAPSMRGAAIFGASSALFLLLIGFLAYRAFTRSAAPEPPPAAAVVVEPPRSEPPTPRAAPLPAAATAAAPTAPSEATTMPPAGSALPAGASPPPPHPSATAPRATAVATPPRPASPPAKRVTGDDIPALR